MTGHGLARMERAMRLPFPMPLRICGDHDFVKVGAGDAPKVAQSNATHIQQRKTVLPVLIEAKIKRTKEMGCFVAGTLVHTKEGLKPIEQIRVGDLVLSRHESGEGELCYQPVTGTFQYENREVFHLGWEARKEASDGKPAWDEGRVAVTGGHPIWVRQFATRSEYATDYQRSITPVNAWMTVDELFLQQWNDMVHFTPETIPTHAWVTLADGRTAVVSSIDTVLQSENPDIGVEFSDVEYWDGNGATLVFGSGGVQKSTTDPTTTLPYADELDYDYTGYDCDSELSAVRRSGGYLPMRRTVYNIEVANTHSYCVGELGLWVSDMGSDTGSGSV